MVNKRSIGWMVLICALLCSSLCVLGWLRWKAEGEAVSAEATATQAWIDALTLHHGAELGQLIEDYEYERRRMSGGEDLKVTVTRHYVLQYNDTRCRAYAAVAVESKTIHNDLDDRPCGFCAVYVFVRKNPQHVWELGAFLPIMGSADDHARDWGQHAQQFEGFIELRPRWEPCPYYGCGIRAGE